MAPDRQQPDRQQPDRQQPPERPRTVLRDWDPAVPSARLLLRHGGDLRQPATAYRAPTQPVPRPTVYVPQRLILPGGDDLEDALRAVEEAAGRLNLQARRACLYGGRDPDAEHRRTRFSETVELIPAPNADAPASTDAWRVLQEVRRTNAELGARISLEHLVFAPAAIGGQGPHFDGFSTGGQGPHFDAFSTGGTAEYSRAGSGGRQVVTWVGGQPARGDKLRTRRPVVAVLDTGCGTHDWFEDEKRDGIRRSPLVAPGVRAGLTDPATDPELHGNLAGPLDGALDSHSGHGTFICGLVRQLCPEADLLTVRVMESDGVVHEGLLMDALEDLHTLLTNYLEGKPEKAEYSSPVDVLVLSLGYYHEEPEDSAFDVPLRTVLNALADLGVIVVCAAGNGATTRPMYPAAFAPHEGTAASADRVPIVSVGSLNPDGSTALFSNDGGWVRAWESGASVVSTVPTTLQGSSQATVSYHERGRDRSTIDPDNFSSGFALWSGTSFAAPVLAGRVAKSLLDDGRLDDKDRAGSVRRAWSALTRVPSLHGLAELTPEQQPQGR